MSWYDDLCADGELARLGDREARERVNQQMMGIVMGYMEVHDCYMSYYRWMIELDPSQYGGVTFHNVLCSPRVALVALDQGWGLG